MEWVKNDITEIKEDLRILKDNQVRTFEKIGDLRGEMHKEFANLHADITSMTRWMLVGILAAVTLISVLHPLMNNWLAK